MCEQRDICLTFLLATPSCEVSRNAQPVTYPTEGVSKVFKYTSVIALTVKEINSFDFFTIRISVRWSNTFKVTQNKINFFKNCPRGV